MKVRLIVGLVVFLLLGAGGAGWHYWEQYQTRQLSDQAEYAFQNGDFALMQEQLEAALERSPNSIELWQLAADLFASSDSAREVEARRWLHENDPGDLEKLEAWLRALQHSGRAEEALAAYRKLAEESNSPHAEKESFLRLGAELAVAAGNKPYAIECYRLLADPASQLARSGLELESLPQNTWGPVIARLERLLAQAELRAEAFRLLVEAHRARGQDAALLALGDRLWETNEDRLAARLLALQAYQAADEERFAARVEELLQEHARRSIALASILESLNALEAYDFVIAAGTAEDAGRQYRQSPLAQYVAEAFILSGRFKELSAYASGVDWAGELGFASMIRPLIETQAMNKANAFPSPEFNRWLRGATLAQLQEHYETAQRLGMKREQEWLLRELVQREPWNRESWDRLYALLAEQKDAVEMFKLLEQMTENFPRDRSLQNEHAYLALVLDMGRLDAVRASERLFTDDPENIDYRTTQALALCMLRRPALALDLLFGYEPLPHRGQVAISLAYRMLAEENAHESSLMQLNPDVTLPEEWRMVIGSQHLNTDDLEEVEEQ
ncbi:MAG: hypothetical protein AAGA45_00960 [Verrucomicrobiota bacterium]